MAVQHYNIIGTDPAPADQNPVTALARLRNLEAVNRFTGLNVVNPGNVVSYTQPGTSTPVDIDFGDRGSLTFDGSNVHLISGPGHYIFMNKTLIFETGSALRAFDDGVHLYFFNCNIIYNTSQGTNPLISTQQATNTTNPDMRVTNDPATSRSVNFYGCTFTAPTVNTANLTMIAGDLFNCTVIGWTGRRGVIAAAGGGGSRFLNLTALGGPNDDLNLTMITSFYGLLDLFEGYAGSFSSIEIAEIFGQTQGLIVEPNFTSREPVRQSYRFQANNIPSRALQAIGPYNPPGNVNDITVTSTDGTPYLWYADPGVNPSTAGGVINYYGWQNGFFSDLAQDNGIQGINVRIESNAILNNTILNGATSGTYSTAISNQTTSTVNLTGGDLTQITDYKTGTTGFPVVGSNTRFSDSLTSVSISITGTAAVSATTANFSTAGIVADTLIGSTFTNGSTEHTVTDNTTSSITFTPALTSTLSGELTFDRFKIGWIDWLRLGAFNLDGYTTNPTTEVAQNFIGQAAPDGCVIAPISLVRNEAYNQFAARFNARGYTHDIDLLDNQNGIIGTAAGNQVPLAVTPIDTTNYIGGDLVGSRIKSSHVNADNTPNFDTFTATSTVSLNDIGNALRAGWAEYNVNANMGATLQTGMFNEMTYPTRVHIRTVAESDWQDPKYGVRVATAGSGGQIRIAVLANGIEGKSDDLYETLPGARTFNFAGLPLSNVELTASERLARIGNINDVILTSGTDSTGPSGDSDFYDIMFEDADVTVTGDCTLSAGNDRVLTQAVMNLPTTVGDTDSNIDIQKATLITSYANTSTTEVGVDGIRDNSVWTNVSTTANVSTSILRNISINGGTHAMVVAGENTTAATWSFRNVNTISIDLPTALPTGLVTINTGSTTSDNTQREVIKAWLDAQSVTYSEAQTAAFGGTPPTSGYWLVAEEPVEFTTTYQVPSSLRTGVFGVKNITTGNMIVDLVVVDSSTPATYQFNYSSTPTGTKPQNYTIGDTIRIYWRPDATETAAYNSVIMDIPTTAPTVTQPSDLAISQIPNVLWSDGFEDDIEDAIGNASMNMIAAGTQPALGGITRSELQFVNAAGILNDPGNGQPRTMYAGFTALNGDTDYLSVIVANDSLTEDYIAPSGNELTVNGAFCYLNTGTTNVQQVVTSIGNSATTGTAAAMESNFLPTTILSGAAAAIIILPNPSGLTGSQALGAANAANASVKRNQAVLLTATQRGALKAATYSAGTLEE